MDGESLAAIIDAARRGDPAAHHALVDRYASRLFGFFYRMTGRRDEAEDLMQEVFLRVLRMIGAYQHDGRFEPWLFRIAANLARDRIRRVRRRPVHLGADSEEAQGEPPAEFAASGPSPSHALELGESVDRLNAALGQLPEGEREVIALRHFSELSFKEIAEMMGTPIGTALARAHRGLARLRSLMEAGDAAVAQPADGAGVGRSGNG